MKIKLTDGTEVEVADDSQVAITAREMEKVKALGYDSVDAYRKAMDEKVAKLEKHNNDNDEFINRQKTELGDLRKEVESLKGGKNEPPNGKEGEENETPEEREEKFREENRKLRAALTDEERAHAEAEFRKEYENADPDARTLLKTEEGKAEFFKLVFPKKSETAPVSLFDAEEKTPLTIGERVRKVLQDDDRGRGRRPIVPQTGGSGFKPNQGAVSKPVHPAVARGGGVLDAVKVYEQTGD